VAYAIVQGNYDFPDGVGKKKFFKEGFNGFSWSGDVLEWDDEYGELDVGDEVYADKYIPGYLSNEKHVAWVLPNKKPDGVHGTRIIKANKDRDFYLTNLVIHTNTKYIGEYNETDDTVTLNNGPTEKNDGKWSYIGFYGKDVESLDTGGYTGSWDSSGRLAMLH
jgi:hypothetical protein